MSSLQDALNCRLEGRFSAGAVIGGTFMLAVRPIHIFRLLALLCYAPITFLGYVIATIGFAVGALLAIDAILSGPADGPGVLIGVFSAIATAQVILRLRVAKEGSSFQELADVFS